MQLNKFQAEQTDRDIISDRVVAAMETGNFAGARAVLAEYEDSFTEEVQSVRDEVFQDYGYRL